jgi:hypothetical protein
MFQWYYISCRIGGANMKININTNPRPVTKQTPEQAEKLRRIAEEQGTLHTSNFEHLLGAGKDLWANDAEFEAFLALIRASREQKD